MYYDQAIERKGGGPYGKSYAKNVQGETCEKFRRLIALFAFLSKRKGIKQVKKGKKRVAISK